MATILISTIGRATKEAGGRYRQLTYRFPTQFSHAGSFFMFALNEYLKQEKCKPDRIVVLGTSSSMWDALLEMTDLEDENLLDAFTREEGNFSQDTLDRLGQSLTEKIGQEMVCKLIPHGEDPQEQMKILQAIADSVPKKANVILDVTHGFRHLPMMQLMAAFYLTQTKMIKIQDIYYGAAEMKRKENGLEYAEVIRLDFIKEMWKWMQALPLAQDAGRYEGVAELMGKESPKFSKAIRSLSFDLQLNQITSASKSAKEAACQLATRFQNPMSELYRKEIQNTLQWDRNHEDYVYWQLHYASHALKKKNYAHCLILLNEAITTMQIANPGKQQDVQSRTIARKALNRQWSGDEKSILAMLRNCVGHGQPPENLNLNSNYGKKVSRLLHHPDELVNFLEGMIAHLKSELSD